MRTMQARKKFIYNHPAKLQIAREIIAHRLDKKIITFSANTKMAEKIGIGYVYSSTMLKDKIDEIVTLKDDNAIDTIFDVNEAMQEKIIDLIAQKLASGESYDYNKIKQLKDEGFDVEAIADEIKNVPKKKADDEE